MKSSIRSKLFLLVYSLILAFIVGLIILNNSFLESYYVKNREDSLIEAFNNIKEYDINAYGYSSHLLSAEENYNLNIQVLEQVTDFNPAFVWSNFDNPPIVYERIYGVNHNISTGVLSKIIYDFNHNLLDTSKSYATKVNKLSDDRYTAYLMDIQTEFNINAKNTYMIGLCVLDKNAGDNDIYYVLTISFQSIQDSVEIFNSFTMIVGLLFMVLSFIALYFITYSFTNPILEINKIAEEISNLNFENKLNIKSDDELGDLGKSINKMSTQLEANIKKLQTTNDRLAKEILHKNKVDSMRKEFIANASHELKTPLSMIMGYSEALKLSDLENNVKEEYISIILDETNKMDKLVQDLLKLSQTENKSVDFELKDFKINSLIDGTVNLFNLKFKEKGIYVKLDVVDRLVNSDYIQLETVLTNFISNAINHIDDKLLIEIKTELMEDYSVRVSVFNTGEHIPESEISHIWDSFYKIDKARTRSYGGQGLGLSICKAILETLGYDYGVVNKPGGVEFYFKIYLV